MRNSEKQRQIVKMLNYKHGFSNKEKLYSVWKNIKDRCYREKCKSYKNYGGRGIKVCDEWKNDYVAFRTWAINNGYKFDAKFQECTIDRINNNGNYEPNNCRIVPNSIQAKNKQNTMYKEKYRECVICHKIFEVKKRKAVGNTCSYKCAGKLRSLRMNEWAEKNLKKECPICHKQFIARDGHFKKRIYCSKKCKDMAKSPIWDFDGKTLNVIEWSKELNITAHCLLHRHKELGWSIEKTLSTPLRRKK